MPATHFIYRSFAGALVLLALLFVHVATYEATDAGPLRYLAESGFGPWTPYLYQYGVGGLFFFLAIVVAGIKGVFRLAHPADRRMVLFLALGFVFYASLHGGWILLVELSR